LHWLDKRFLIWYIWADEKQKRKQGVKMKLIKQDTVIEIKPFQNYFQFNLVNGYSKRYNGGHYTLFNTPKTYKAIRRLYNKGYHEGYIDYKMVIALIPLVIIVICFFIF
jgi:hypothetical protein